MLSVNGRSSSLAKCRVLYRLQIRQGSYNGRLGKGQSCNNTKPWANAQGQVQEQFRELQMGNSILND